jgi:hypothetical protein
VRSLVILAIGLASVQGEPPAKPLDPKDARSVVEHALYNTRSQKSYETAFWARLEAPLGAYDYKGRSVWVSPDILYLEFSGSGKNEQKIVRAGEKSVWVYHSPSGQWPRAEELGDAGAGRGIQNPDEVLGLLAKHTATAKFLKSGAIELAFTGNDLVKIMKGHAGAINPKTSSAKVELVVDRETRIEKFACDATLVLLAGDKNRYTSEITLVGYNGATGLVFTDEKKRPIPLPAPIKEGIDAVLKLRK